MTDRVYSDTESRDLAINPTKSFIVQAPAGSGKTELLIQRFLALLATAQDPESVLAITFTRKAAAEMRNRIVQALHGGRDENPPENGHKRKTWELARAVLDRNTLCDWKLTEMPGRLRIQTIDSLCHSLTRQMPITSEMGGAVRPDDNADELYHEAARASLRELEDTGEHAEAVRTLLEHLGGGVGRAESLLVTMLGKRGHWLPHIADKPNRTSLEAALRETVERQLSVVAELIPAEQRGEIIELWKYATANLTEDGRTHDVLFLHGLNEFPDASGDMLLAWKGVKALFLKADGEWRKPKGVNVTLGFPAGEEGKSMKARHAEAINALSTVDELETALAAVAGLPPITYTESQWQVLQALFVVLKRATAHLKLAFSIRRTLDHQAVQEQALQALGDDLAPTDLAERLDFAIRHILVDEFQDTSRGQFELLKRLIEGWTPDDGRTLFLVGDPMQSIYRFREAEVALFLQAERDGIGHIPLEKLTLRRNFRSRSEVVDWVNGAFTSVLPAESNAARGAVSYSESDSTRGEGGLVCIHPHYENVSTSEAEKVLAVVRERLEATTGQIAILGRSRKQFEAIVPALRDAGIPFLGKDLEKLGELQEIQDLLALTKALLHPGDRAAWLAVLRAPWCGLGLADLTALFSSDKYRATPDLLSDDALTSTLTSDGQRRLTKIKSVLDKAWENRRRRLLSRWVEGVWLGLGGPATTPSAVALESARVFIELLEEHEVGGDIHDFAALQEGANSIYAPPDPSEGIRVELMTMHGAKGLQFDTVIIPGLGKKSGKEDPRLLMWLEHQTSEDNKLLLAPIKGAFESDDPIHTFIKRLDKEHGDYELGRLLYVAATRAEEQLHLFGHAAVNDDGPAPTANTLLEKLWSAVSDVFKSNAPEVLPDDTTEQETEKAFSLLPQAIRRFPADWSVPTPPESAPLPDRVEAVSEQEDRDEFDFDNRSARHVGTVVHLALMRIARDGIESWDGVVADRKALWERLLMEKGVARDDAERQAERVLAALEQSLAHDRGRWILDDHDHAASELSISGFVDGSARRYIIDRTFVDDGTRWIIDFKTGSPTHDESMESFLQRQKQHYQDQLARYGVLFTQEDLPIRLGLYFPMIKGWVEWEFEA